MEEKNAEESDDREADEMVDDEEEMMDEIFKLGSLKTVIGSRIDSLDSSLQTFVKFGMTVVICQMLWIFTHLNLIIASVFGMTFPKEIMSKIYDKEMKTKKTRIRVTLFLSYHVSSKTPVV